MIASPACPCLRVLSLAFKELEPLLTPANPNLGRSPPACTASHAQDAIVGQAQRAPLSPAVQLRACAHSCANTARCTIQTQRKGVQADAHPPSPSACPAMSTAGGTRRTSMSFCDECMLARACAGTHRVEAVRAVTQLLHFSALPRCTDSSVRTACRRARLEARAGGLGDVDADGVLRQLDRVHVQLAAGLLRRDEPQHRVARVPGPPRIPPLHTPALVLRLRQKQLENKPACHNFAPLNSS